MDSKTTRQQLLSAKKCFDNNDTKGAELLLFKVLEKDPLEIDALLGIARVKTFNKEWNEAIKYQRLALKYGPGESDILSYLCQLLLFISDFKEIVREINSFSSRYSVPIDLMKFLLVGMYDSYEIKNCEKLLFHWQIKTNHDFKLLINSLPKNPDLSLLRIVLTVATEKFPNEPSFWQNLANIEARLSNYTLALAAFDRAMTGKALTPALGIAYADLCILAHKLNEAQKWLDLIADKLLIDEQIISWTETQIRIHHFNGNTKEAVKHSHLLMKKTDANGYAWRALIEEAKVEDLSVLLKKLTKSLNLVPDPFHYNMMSYALAKGYDRLEEFDLAFNCYELANKAQRTRLKQSGHFYSSNSQHDLFESLKNITIPPLSLSENEKEYRPIFLVGLPRSGSTLLEKVLALHPNVMSLGECPDWGNLMNDRLIKLISNRKPSHLNEAEIVDFREQYINTVGAGKAISIDKMPHNFRFVPFILAAFPNAKIVQLRRRKEAVCWSIFTQPFSDVHNYSTSLNDIADFYQRSYELMDHWLEQYPTNILDIEYENVVENTEHTLSVLFEWCGLNWDPKFLDFHLSNKPSFTFSENQVRQPINSKGLGKWLNYKSLFPLELG